METARRPRPRKRSHFLSSPFAQAVDLLIECNVPRKIASGEVSNLPLLERIAQTGLPALLSSGMSRWDELRTRPNFCRTPYSLAVLQCIGLPCPRSWGLNLRQMRNALLARSD
jgi:N-acetylneuraminate synthase